MGWVEIAYDACKKVDVRLGDGLREFREIAYLHFIDRSAKHVSPSLL
jgi:hypothetical protein